MSDKSKYEKCQVRKAEITSNVTGDKLNLLKYISVDYKEDLFSDTIEVDYVFRGTDYAINDKPLSEGLPLIGTEDFSLVMEDAKKNKIKVELNVNKVTPGEKDSQKDSLVLNLKSEEFIRNEESKSAVTKRYDGKISEHIRKILTDNLKTKKKLNIEDTNNNFNFIGNRRRSFYIINWLSKKSIPSVNGKRGDTAGYFLYENAEGFNYESIDTMFARKHEKSYVLSGMPESGRAYDGEVVRMTIDNKIIANQKLRMGAFKTKLILFDPFNCFYQVIEQSSDESDEGTTHAGKGLPILNKKFSGETTRTTWSIKDTGTLPTGNVKQQVDKNQEQIFEIDSILNQAIRRYNQLQIGAIEIDIAADFTLKVGQTVFVDAPSSNNDINVDKQVSGKYLIAKLAHSIRENKGQTKLGLIRDSFGRAGKPHSGSTLS